MKDRGGRIIHGMQPLLHGKYGIGETLGRGGFGLTCSGWDLTPETAACLKEYLPNGAAMRDSFKSTVVCRSSGGFRVR